MLKNKEEKYIPTIDDLVNFTSGFETYQSEPYILKTLDGNDQILAGYGSTNPKIIDLARKGELTEQIAKEDLKNRLQKEYDMWYKLVPNFKNLPIGVQLALVDTSYNGKGVSSTIKNSPSLMNMINQGIIDPLQLVQQMDHSKSAGGWLGVRSSARRAMAQDKYDWLYNTLDKFGRQVDYTKYKGPEDWKSSPYYGVYKQGGIIPLKRIGGKVESGKSEIYIKPSHRGKLTSLKKRTGKTESELWKTGGPSVRKMITFARNARKWKHK